MLKAAMLEQNNGSIELELAIKNRRRALIQATQQGEAQYPALLFYAEFRLMRHESPDQDRPRDHQGSRCPRLDATAMAANALGPG
jgi:hypothetical protein